MASDYEAFRARRLAEEAAKAGGHPANADEAFELKKTAVAAQHGKWNQGTSKRAIDLDTAAADADEVNAGHKRLAGGVKPLDMEAIKAADKDKDWAKKSPEDQAAEAKAAKPAHTTSTPGPAPRTSVAAAMDAAGVKPSAPVASSKPKITVSPEVGARARREPSPAPSPAVAAQNNMGNVRGGDKGSVLGGLASSDSQSTRDAARAAATKGTRGTSNRKAEADAARSSSRRSAASAAPVKGPQFTRLGDSGSELSSAPGRDWVTPSQISGSRPAPVANPAPVAPAPASKATPAAPSAPTQPPLPSAPHAVFSGGVVGAKPGAGITPAHMASSAPGRDWLNPRTANNAKAKAAPKAAVVEPITPAAPAPTRFAQQPPAPAPSAAPKASPVAGPAPSRTAPQPQKTPMAAPQAAKAAGSDHSHAASPAMKQKIIDTMSKGMSGLNDVGKAPRPSAPATVSPPPGAMTRTSTPVTTPSGPVGGGRSGGVSAAPRGGGNFGGGDHSINIGGDNHGTITHNHNHNTTINNYGTMGNVAAGNGGGGGGTAGRTPGSSRGGGTPVGHGPQQQHEHFDLWVNAPATGHHSLHEGIQHVTGKADGHGKKLALPKGKGTAGGTQRPINGSPRAAGQTQATTPNNTGTTHNWQSPIHTAPTSASGNGTANPTP